MTKQKSSRTRHTPGASGFFIQCWAPAAPSRQVVAFLKRPLVTSEVAAATEDGSFSGGGSEDGNLWRRIRRFPRQFELKSGQLQKPLTILGKVLEEKAEENYASLNLVHHCWVDLGDHREIGAARAHDDFLDNRAWHHRIDYRRRRYAPVFAADRTISSRRHHFFHAWGDPGSLPLH